MGDAVTLPATYVCYHCGATHACKDEDLWAPVNAAGAVGMLCLRCGKVTYVQTEETPPDYTTARGAVFPAAGSDKPEVIIRRLRDGTDTPPNGATSSGALKAADVSPASAAAPAVHDCNRCRWWQPDFADVSSPTGICPPLHMTTMARGGGCETHFLPDVVPDAEEVQ